MNYKLFLIKIYIYQNYFFFFSYFNLPILNNFYIFLNNFLLFKKNNSFLKKKLINFNQFFYIKNPSNLNFTDSNVFLNFFSSKYFSQLQFTNNNVNTTKFLDIKKKLYKNIINYKELINVLYFKKKKTNLYYFKNFKKNFFLNNFNFNIVNIFLKIKFIFNISDFFFLKCNKFIFKNRSPINDSSFHLLVKTNDFIEIFFFKFYYLYLLKINLFLMSNKFLNYKNKNIDLSSKNLKKKSNKMIINSFYDNFSKFIFLEIDIFTLSFIVLYNCFNFLKFSNEYKLFTSIYLHKLYKWKN